MKIEHLVDNHCSNSTRKHDRNTKNSHFFYKKTQYFYKTPSLFIKKPPFFNEEEAKKRFGKAGEVNGPQSYCATQTLSPSQARNFLQKRYFFWTGKMIADMFFPP
jgi:hypothetical protein